MFLEKWAPAAFRRRGSYRNDTQVGRQEDVKGFPVGKAHAGKRSANFVGSLDWEVPTQRPVDSACSQGDVAPALRRFSRVFILSPSAFLMARHVSATPGPDPVSPAPYPRRPLRSVLPRPRPRTTSRTGTPNRPQRFRSRRTKYRSHAGTRQRPRFAEITINGGDALAWVAKYSLTGRLLCKGGL